MGGSSPRLLSLECPPLPQREPFSRMQAQESEVFLRPLGLYTRLSPGKASLESFMILAGRHEDLLISRPPTTCLRSRLAYLELLFADLEWAASFLGLPLFSMYGGQFVKQQLASHPQSPKKHTSLPPCQEFSGHNLEPAPGTQRAGREQRNRQAPPAEYAADLISKGNIYTGFVWGRSRRSRSRHLPADP